MTGTSSVLILPPAARRDPDADRGAGRDRRRRATTDRDQSRLRPAALRSEPAGGAASSGQCTVEDTLARLHESDAAMAALAEELGQLSSTARSAYAEAERLRRPSPRPRRRETATSPGSSTSSTASSLRPKPSTRGNRIRRNVTGWRKRPGSPARRWMPASRCGPSRNGHAPSLVEPMRCGGPPKANVRRASARSPVASDWCVKHVPRLPYTPGRASGTASGTLPCRRGARALSGRDHANRSRGRAERGADIGALPDAGLRVVRRRQPIAMKLRGPSSR